ncbi:hypothetical protein ACSSZE_12915 [Acidithiobacillus caldus]
MYVDTSRYTIKEKLVVGMETIFQLFMPVIVLFLVLCFIAAMLALGMWIFSGTVHFTNLLSWMCMIAIALVPVLVLFGLLFSAFMDRFAENLVYRFGKRR